MALNIEQIKTQIVANIKKTFPKDKQEYAISQIEKMSREELQEFLEKNNIIKDVANQECIFCSISKGAVPSYKLDENEDAIAVLEINPVSKGHILIIPKKHLSKKEDLPKGALNLAKKISKKIEAKLKPQGTKISSSNMFGHEIINVMPVYKNETLSSQRTPADEEDLKELQKILEEKKKPKKEVIKKPKKEKIKIEKLPEKLWLPKRIP